MKFAANIFAGYYRLLRKRQATRIAEQIFPALWESAKRKITSGPGHRADLRLYAQSRAAQLAQPHVDNVMRANPRLAPTYGNHLLLLTAARAASLVEDAALQSQVAGSVG